MDAAFGNTQVEISQHPRGLAIVPKPGIVKRKGAGSVCILHARGHALAGIHQRLPHAQRLHVGNLSHLSIRKLKCARCIVNHRARGMRSNHYGAAQLAIDAKESVKEIAFGHRIELRGWFIEQQQRRLRHKGRGEGEQLLASARKRIGALPKPIVDTKEIARLGNEAAHLVLRGTQVLKAKCHLVPYALAHDLIVGILKYIADGPCALRVIELANINAAHHKRALANAGGRDLRLEQREQRRLARTGTAYEDGESAAGDLPAQIAQHGAPSLRI